MGEHTEGPWHTSPTCLGAAYDIGAANGDNIALVFGPTKNGSENFAANARLIAAAPDLLEALEAYGKAVGLACVARRTAKRGTGPSEREIANTAMRNARLKAAGAIAKVRGAS